MLFLNNYTFEFRFPIQSPCSSDQIQVYSSIDGQRICVDEKCQFPVSPEAIRVRETLLKVAQFFQTKFGLCGINGLGQIPPIFINWEEKNAQWWCGVQDKCTACMQACGWRFNNQFIFIPEVVAHEYVHGLIHNLSKLNKFNPISCQRNEAGALDESIADVLAITFKYWLGEGNWIMGGINRNLSRPVTMNNFIGSPVCTEANDYGHVHANSSIPSHAFYLAVQNLGEAHIERFARIWCQAFQQIDNAQESFFDFSIKTLRIAKEELKEKQIELTLIGQKSQQAIQDLVDVFAKTQSIEQELIEKQNQFLSIENELINTQEDYQRIKLLPNNSTHTFTLNQLFKTNQEKYRMNQQLLDHTLILEKKIRELQGISDQIYASLQGHQERFNQMQIEFNLARRALDSLQQAWQQVGVLPIL